MQITDYLTQDEAAARLRLSPRSLERYRLTGAGPKFIRTPRRVLYRIADIDAWTAGRTFSSTAEADAGKAA